MFYFFEVAQNLYETMRVHFPEMVMFPKLLFDPSLTSLPLVSITPGEVDLFIPKI
jgi:hypothetical protein